MPPELLIVGVPLVVVVTGLVELAKRAGMSTEWAGLAAIGISGAVVGLVELQDDRTWGVWATWALMSIVYGLAANGFYSQVKKLIGAR
jgi:hypothetical protein